MAGDYISREAALNYVASWKQKKMDRLRDRLARDGIEQRGWPDGNDTGD